MADPPQNHAGWRALYPFASRWVGVPGGRMHYIDEGPTDYGARPSRGTLLFVHGNPTWSFHWRRLVESLRPHYRCVAVDHIGCGLSDKPPKFLTLDDHIQILEAFVNQLGLDRLTLVAQDWGGAIGLGTMLRMPERLTRIVLFNTGAFPPRYIPWRIRACRVPLVGQLAVQGANLFSLAALRMTLARHKRLAPAVDAGYLAPYDSWANRRGVYGFVRDIPKPRRQVSPKLASEIRKNSATWDSLAEIERGLPSLAGVPSCLIWGMRDWCFRPDCLDRFMAAWPRADVHRLADVGHWVEEDAPEESLRIMTEFLGAPTTHKRPTRTRRQISARKLSRNMPSIDESSTRLSLANAATLACIWEVSAPKPGNVHCGADFEDVTFLDFIASAVVAGPIVARAAELGVGRAVLEAVRATREIAGSNTNLGTLLLLAPLAAVPEGVPLASGVGEVLQRLTFDDTRDAYEAIRTASAGGLGRAGKADVFDNPPAELHLVDAMRMAADRDLVARQYTNQFVDVFGGTAKWIEEGQSRGWPLATAIVHAHLRQLAKEPDSLVQRKCGMPVAKEASDRAASVLEAGLPGETAFEEAIGNFDFWLRSDGHRRNPGTTADLIAAGLFVLLREGQLRLDA